MQGLSYKKEKGRKGSKTDKKGKLLSIPWKRVLATAVLV